MRKRTESSAKRKNRRLQAWDVEAKLHEMVSQAFAAKLDAEILRLDMPGAGEIGEVDIIKHRGRKTNARSTKTGPQAAVERFWKVAKVPKGPKRAKVSGR